MSAEAQPPATLTRLPGADNFAAETVTRVRVTYLVTGQYAEGLTQDEAFCELVGTLLCWGDISAAEARGLLGTVALPGAGQ